MAIAADIEVTTGAQREHRHAVLLKQAAGKGMNTEPWAWTHSAM
ncbi:MAG: hypothetical protein ACRDR6_06265 [Pseudonocardiaceae bacterium]